MTVAQGTPRTDAEHATSPENGAVPATCYGRMVALSRQLERENAALSAQIVELQKDAERYRYVRAKPAMLLHLKNSEFDAAIDEKAGL